MAQAISIEIYQLLEERLGKEEGRKVTEAINIALEAIEKRAEAVALQKKLEIKDELTKELATKADIVRLEREIQTVRQEIQTVRQEIQTVRVDIEGKLRLYFLILIFVIILVSPSAIDLIGKFFGVIK
jgi:ABC-type phosphate transport system auxiliary subunit